MHEQIKTLKEQFVIVSECAGRHIYLEQDLKSTVSVSFFFVHYDLALASQSDEELT